VLALAHPSLTGINSRSGSSGSTGWDAIFRSRLYLSTPKSEEEEPPDPYVRVLTRKKANYATREESIDLRWRDGVFIATQAGGIVGAIDQRTCERVFLDLLDATMAEKQPVSLNSRAGNYAPRIFAQRPNRGRFGKSDLERAMQSLLANREIINVPYGRKSDQRYRIERSSQSTGAVH
jgi:RecA-family ATPase